MNSLESPPTGTPRAGVDCESCPDKRKYARRLEVQWLREYAQCGIDKYRTSSGRSPHPSLRPPAAPRWLLAACTSSAAAHVEQPSGRCSTYLSPERASPRAASSSFSCGCVMSSNATSPPVLTPASIVAPACSWCSLHLQNSLRFVFRSRVSVNLAKGMTTDVYPRDNCIAPDIAFIVWTTNTKSACARVGVASGRDGRMIDLRMPSLQQHLTYWPSLPAPGRARPRERGLVPLTRTALAGKLAYSSTAPCAPLVS